MKLSRRALRRILWVVGFGCLWIPVFDDPPLRTGPYVQDVGRGGATLARIFAEPTEAVFEYGLADEDDVRTVAAPARRRHALRCDELLDGRVYRYRVRARDEGGDWSTFRTPPVGDAAPVRFAFCGDSGDQPWWVWLQRNALFHLPGRWHLLPTSGPVTGVGAAMAAAKPDFALHLGDVIYPKGLHAHYSSGFFRPFGELIRSVPFYPVLGNHDVMNVGGLQLLRNFHLPTNDVTGDARCYSFGWGAVRVIVLDCNTWFSQLELPEDHPTRRFLRTQLRKCEEPWVVVASHFPVLSASRSKGSPGLRKYLLPELEAYAVSLYLAGHDHCYQRFGPNEVTAVPLVVSGGGGKRLYAISDNPRERRGAEVLESSYHWCSVDVAGARFELVSHGLDGAEIDRVHLQLPSGEALERLRQQNPARAARIEAL